MDHRKNKKSLTNIVNNLKMIFQKEPIYLTEQNGYRSKLSSICNNLFSDYPVCSPYAYYTVLYLYHQL